MGIVEILALAVALSADAFAIALSLGLSMKKATLKKSLIVGLYFGAFQAVMPVIGYFAATLFADQIKAFDHWVAFSILVFLGAKMILSAFEKKNGGCQDRECPPEDCADRDCPGRVVQAEPDIGPKKMLPFAVATSIDALAAGITVAIGGGHIGIAAPLIGVITLTLSIIGVKLGGAAGKKIGKPAVIAGGIILALMGLKILLSDLGIIGF